MTKTIELISPLNDSDSRQRSHFQEYHGLNVGGGGRASSTCSGGSNDRHNGRPLVGVHRSNSSPSKPIGRKGSFCGSSTSSFSNGVGGGSARRSYQQRHFFDDDYIVTYSSSTSHGAKHQTVTKRNEDNDDFKTG